MRAAFKGKRRSVAGAPLRKRRGPAKPKASKALVKVVTAVAKTQALRQLETKFVVNTVNNAFNSSINTGFLEMYSLIPQVQAGTGDWQRVNQDLVPINIRTDWHVSLTNAPRTMNIRCALYCLQHKSIRHFPDLASIITGPNMLKAGTSLQITNYDGSIQREDLPINTDEYTLLRKFTFNLMGNVGAPNGDTTAGNAPNVLPTYKKLTYTLPLKSGLNYSPNVSAIYPNGHAPFWVFGYSHVDGTAPDVLNTDVQISSTTQMTYKDA